MRSPFTTKQLRHLSFGIGVFFLFSCGGNSDETEIDVPASNGSDSTLVPYQIGAFQFDSVNLLTTTFLNGDPIKRAQSEEEWQIAAENNEPAYCLCGEDSSVVLYNFYALSDPRGIIEQDRLLSLEDARKMQEGDFRSYFSKGEPTIERSYSGKFYDLELINWWVIGDNDSACVMCWKPDGTDMKLQEASKANGFCVRPIKK
ncbi:MAG: hypothetical protein ACO2Z9_03540 [Crocinitomicaceae bacterium]